MWGYDYFVTFQYVQYDFSICAGLKYKKVLVFSYLVLKHFIGNGDHSKQQIQFLLGCWLTWPKSLLKLCFHNMMVLVYLAQDTSVWLVRKTTNKRYPFANKLSLCNCLIYAQQPVEFPFLFFFPRRPSWFKTSIVIPKTVHRRLTAHTVSPTVGEIFLNDGVQEPTLNWDITLALSCWHRAVANRTRCWNRVAHSQNLTGAALRRPF